MSAPIYPLPLETRMHLNASELARVVRPRVRAALRFVLEAMLSELDGVLDEDGNLPPRRPKPAYLDLRLKSRKILEAATDKPQSATRIARLADVAWNADTARVFTDLVRQRLLVRLPDGYIVAD